MAIDAQLWNVLVLFPGMAEIAAHLLVLACQFVFGLAVVKGSLAPFLLSVAIAAFFTEFFMMGIFVFVT